VPVAMPRVWRDEITDRGRAFSSRRVVREKILVNRAMKYRSRDVRGSIDLFRAGGSAAPHPRHGSRESRKPVPRAIRGRRRRDR